jgi:Mor family transcriptional regulator
VDSITLTNILSDYQSGIGCRKIAQKYNFPRQTILYHLHKNGVIRTPESCLKEIPEQEIINEYKLGTNIELIADKFNIHSVTVHKVVKRNGIEKRVYNLSCEQKLDIINQYLSGAMGPDIARQYGITSDSVYHTLEINGIDRRRYNKFTDSQVTQIIVDYNNGQSMYSLAKKYGVSGHCIEDYLEKSGIEVRSGRRYCCNFDFFEKIDTEIKAYWLGFMFADGWVIYLAGGKPYYGFGIKLAVLDTNHLSLYKQSLNADYPIRMGQRIDEFGKTHYFSYLIMYSKKVANDLINKGCVQNKTHVGYGWPTNAIVPDCLKHHFARGYFDGDGCIYTPDNISNSLFSINACLDFCKGYQQWLMEQCGLNEVKIMEKPEIWNLPYGGRLQLKRIYGCLYRDATIYLERKKTIFDKIMGSL